MIADKGCASDKFLVGRDAARTKSCLVEPERNGRRMQAEKEPLVRAECVVD